MKFTKYRTTVVIMIFLLIGFSFLIIKSSPVNAQVEDEVRLYLGTPQRLSTSPPPALDIPNLGIQLTNGETAEYTLEYPLAFDLPMEGSMDSGSMVILLHLENYINFDSSPQLNVELYEDPLSGSSLLIAGTELDEQDLAEDEINVPFQSSQGYEARKGSEIRLVLTYSSSGGLGGMSFAYSSTSGQGSYIEFRTEVFSEDPIEVLALDNNGNPITEVIPYGPQEAREVDFSVSVKDVFGANDIDSIAMTMTSSVGSVLFNTSTDDPQPDGGEPITYFNYTFEIPEGTPTDTYTITATARSFTGVISEASMDLEIAPGLFLSLQESELEVDAGDIATFTLEVLNGGDGIDRVSFSATSNLGWNIDVPSDIEIGGGDMEEVTVRVYVPLRAQSDDVDTLTISAASRNADKDYEVEGTIEVMKAASYGLEPVGDISKSVLAGQSVDYEIRVINILDEAKEFEMSAEDIPSNWDVQYDSPGGAPQGSLYMFEINATGEELVSVSIDVSDSGPFGRNEISLYVRAKGETDRKYLYLTTNVVDDTRDVVELSSGTNRRTASRTGTGYPVTYSKVYFSLDLYNPSLRKENIEMTVDSPGGWDLEFDYDDIDLEPGEGSTWNLTVIPEAGASWQGGSPYLVQLEVDAGSMGEFSQRLEVVIPKVTVVKNQREWSDLDVTLGDTVLVNLTLQNRGNHPEEIDITLDLPSGLIMNYTQRSVSIASGGSKTIRGELSVNEVERFGTVGFKIMYESSKGTTTLDYSLKVSEKQEDDENDLLIYVAIGAGVVIAVAGAFLIYMKFFSNRSDGPERTKKETPKRPPSKGVSVSAEPPRRASSTKAVPAVDPDVIKEADDILANILGEGGDSTTKQKFEVVEAQELE